MLRFHDSPILQFFLLLLAVLVLFSGLGRPAFMDHEGRYAEVAREMLLSGDWVTPHLNFAVFLNKSPLPYWLTALTFLVTGLSEYARLWQAVTALLVLVVTVLLGQALAGRRAGLFAGAVLLTSGGFFLESRLLRPDLLMTLWLCLTLLGVVKALPSLPSTTLNKNATWWIILSAASLGLSVLTKGMVGVVLAGGIIGGVLLWSRRLALLRQVPWLSALGIGLLILLPWHVMAGVRNEGFWWDYVVNQHLLFFFDRKFPRDSLPDSVLVFWGAFLGRTFPWVAFVPVATRWALVKAWKTREPQDLLPVVWLGVVLGFFTLSPSRLEHYTVPVLPAVALAIGSWWAALSEQQKSPLPPFSKGGAETAPFMKGGRAQRQGILTGEEAKSITFGFLAPILCSGLMGLIGFFALPSLLATKDWAREFPSLLTLARLVCGGLVLTAGIAGVVLWRGGVRTSSATFAVMACAAAPLYFCTYRALVEIEPVNSWKPIGVRLAALLPPDGEAVFAASDEYQICGGLNFYSGKPLSILLPDGYIPPTYLRLDGQAAFVTRADFTARWQSNRPLLLVVDPERQDADLASWAPPPRAEVGRWGTRRMFANQAFLARTALAPD